MPSRFQLSRAKGWRMPSGAIKCDRSTPLGNPFRVGIDGDAARCVELHARLLAGWVAMTVKATPSDQLAHRAAVLDRRNELRGKDLGCWCGPDAPCHVDNLIRFCNPAEETAT